MSLEQQISEIKQEGHFLMGLSIHYEHIVAHMVYECVFFMALLFDAYIVITEGKLITSIVLYYFPIHILIFNGLISFAAGAYLCFSSLLIVRSKDSEEIVLSIRNYIITTVFLQHTKYPLILLAGSMMWGFAMWKYLYLQLGLSLIISIIIPLCSYSAGVVCALVFVVSGEQWKDYLLSMANYTRVLLRSCRRRRQRRNRPEHR